MRIGCARVSTLDQNPDLSWAKPLIEEALADVEQGRVMSLDAHLARGAAALRDLKS